MPIFGWPVVFYVGGIAPILLALLLIFTLPESVRFLALKKGRRQRVAGLRGESLRIKFSLPALNSCCARNTGPECR